MTQTQMPQARLELARPKPTDFESVVYTSSTIEALADYVGQAFVLVEGSQESIGVPLVANTA
jgi:hypothetical protein